MKILLVSILLTFALQFLSQHPPNTHNTLQTIKNQTYINFQTTTLSIQDYLSQNNLIASDIQIILIINQNGQLELSNGEMIGLVPNTSKRIVIFCPSLQFDSDLLQVKINNSPPVKLNDNKSIQIDEIQNLYLSLYNSSIKINL